MLAGRYAAAIANGQTPTPAPRLSANGSLTHYITHAETKKFQPANITFDLLPPSKKTSAKRSATKKNATASSATAPSKPGLHGSRKPSDFT